MQVTRITRPEDVYSQSLLGTKVWDGDTITFSFPSRAQFTGYGDNEPWSSHSALNNAQLDAIRTILAQISTFTNLTFVELDGNDAGSATMRFGITDSTDAAFAYLPRATEIGGDAWFTSADYMDSPEFGTWAYMTLMHEIGHALGLVHPHDPSVGPAMPTARDWQAFTVMSYRSYLRGPLETGYTVGDASYPQSYMMEDISALQYAYGANFSFRNDDTTYRFNPNEGAFSINGEVSQSPLENKIFLTIWDGGGIDTYDFSAYNRQVDIDLRPEMWTNSGGGQRADLGSSTRRPPGIVANPALFEGDTRSLIENAIGGSDNDTIRGNQLDNILQGMSGGDAIFGYEGNDHISGGLGNDGLFGHDGDDVLLGGDGDDRLDGADGDDLLVGGDGDDRLDGGFGQDILRGGVGNDELTAMRGDNNLTGSAGNDILQTGRGNDWLSGGSGDDKISAGPGNDFLRGGAGNDYLDGGNGRDKMIGGTGDDTYVIDNVGDVIIELEDEGIDTIKTPFDLVLGSQFENGSLLGSEATLLTGNLHDNILLGNYADNIIDGGAGADTMAGAGGNDTYYVDSSEDTVSERVGAGIDVVYASASFALASGYNDPNWNPYASATMGSTPWIPGSEVEFVYLVGTEDIDARGNELDNTLVGNSGDNILRSGEGADNLYGMDGADILRGDEGDDRLIAGTGNDTVNGGSGNDRVLGNGGNDRLFGMEGDDFLSGSSGNDLLDGGDGADILDGGKGRDTASGGLGADVFVFGNGDLGGLRSRVTDKILDFSRSDGDVIDLSDIDAVSGGADDAFDWIGKRDFSGVAGELRWEATGDAGVTVLMDTNGDGLADLVLFLQGVSGVALYDFVL